MQLNEDSDLNGEYIEMSDRPAGEDMEMSDRQTGEILAYYRNLPGRSSQETIVEMLRELQDLHGCISPVIRELAADAAGVKPSMVQTIVKRMPSLKESAYIHEIVLCTGGRCAPRGNMELLRDLKQRLGIGKDGISRDGKVCLKTRSCLKHCRTAPNVMIDGCMYSGKDADDIVKMVTNTP